MCNIKATKAKAHPLQLRQGLIWVWPQAGPDAATEAAATQPVVAHQLDDPRWSSDYGWIWREVQVSFDYAIENSLDTAHAPFAHHGCLGISMADARTDAARKVTRADPKWGVELVNDPPATAGLLANFRQTHTFEAPGLFHVLNDQGQGPFGGMEIKLVVYRTPVKAGSCYVFYNNIKRGVNPELQAKMAKAKKSTLQAHLDMLRFFDADLIIMHEQERLVQDKGGWRSAYCMPHHTDAGVLAFRRWLDAAGPVPYKDSSILGPILPRERVLEHYESHVLRCPDCQKGLHDLRKQQRAALAASIALAVASVAVAAAQAMRTFLHSTPGTGMAAKAAAVVASNGGFTETLANTIAAAATGSGAWWWLLPLSGVAMAVGAGWLYLKVYKGLRQWEQDNVYFRDYDLRYGPDYRPSLPT